MTDLETAVLDILRHHKISLDSTLPAAMTLDEIHAHLVGRGWHVIQILPRHITAALVALTSANLIRNEQSWRAVEPPAPTVPEPKP